jgi:soluble P-type ATPase
MSNELFTDVTEEQQQIVAGGSLSDSVFTNFNLDQAVLSVGIASGEKGSEIEQEFAFKKVDTSASKYLNYYPSYYY